MRSDVSTPRLSHAGRSCPGSWTLHGQHSSDLVTGNICTLEALFRDLWDMGDLVPNWDDVLDGRIEARFDVLGATEPLPGLRPDLVHEEQRRQLTEIHVIDHAQRIGACRARTQRLPTSLGSRGASVVSSPASAFGRFVTRGGGERP